MANKGEERKKERERDTKKMLPVPPQTNPQKKVELQ